MNCVAAVLLFLSYLSISNGWSCTEGPQMPGARQIDAGQGEVVFTDKDFKAFYLSGSSWFRLGTVPLKHVSVGAAGIWGVDSSNTVYKYVSGNFIGSIGLSLKQVDAGGLGQVVGATNSDTVHCLKRSIASKYKQMGFLVWDTLPGLLTYFTCSPDNNCWGVTGAQTIFHTTISPNCTFSNWTPVSGIAKMVEVGSDGDVFVVNSPGDVYQRTGISASVPHGTNWVKIPMCLPVNYLSYDLGHLWVVTKGGVILDCTP